MIDFSLSEEQKSLQETVRRFAVNEVRPVAGKMDRLHDPAECFPRELVKKGMQLGFSNVLIPEKYGGLGGSLIDYSLVVEELAYGDAGIADVFLVNISLSRVLIKGGMNRRKRSGSGRSAKTRPVLLFWVDP